MSGPLTGVRREAGWAGGDARGRPVCPARSAGLPWPVLGTGGGAARPRPGPCARGAAGPTAVLAAHGPARGAAPRARRSGRLALAAARRALRAVCRRPGRAAAASRSSSPGGVPADFAGCAGISRRPGRGPGASLPGPGAVPHPPLVRAPCPDRCPGPGPGGMRYLARHLMIARLPPPGPPGGGMMPALPSPAPSPPWPGSDRAARASPELPAWPGGTGAGGLPVLLRAAVSPHRPSGPCPDFFESCCSSWSPVTESNRRPSPYHGRPENLQPTTTQDRILLCLRIRGLEGPGVAG